MDPKTITVIKILSLAGDLMKQSIADLKADIKLLQGAPLIDPD